MSEQKQPPEEQEEEIIEEGQHGGEKGIAREEALKHVRKQHPKRDIPRVESSDIDREA